MLNFDRWKIYEAEPICQVLQVASSAYRRHAARRCDLLRRSVGWGVSQSVTTEFVLDTLEQALQAHHPGNDGSQPRHSDKQLGEPAEEAVLL